MPFPHPYASSLPTVGTSPAPHTFVNSFGRAAKSKVWPIRHWGGNANSNPLLTLCLVAQRSYQILKDAWNVPFLSRASGSGTGDAELPRSEATPATSSKSQTSTFLTVSWTTVGTSETRVRKCGSIIGFRLYSSKRKYSLNERTTTALQSLFLFSAEHALDPFTRTCGVSDNGVQTPCISYVSDTRTC